MRSLLTLKLLSIEAAFTIQRSRLFIWCEEGLRSPQKRDYIIIKKNQNPKESKLRMHCIFHSYQNSEKRQDDNVNNQIKCKEESTKRKYVELVMKPFPIILPTTTPPFSVCPAYPSIVYHSLLTTMHCCLIL